MMDPALVKAYGCGYERLASWADLIDRINVFPVADSDTGRNLRISLTPLRCMDGSRDRTLTRLLISATGNSGNIAARFFAGLLQAKTPGELTPAAAKGSADAWESISDPRQGTMLTVFDRLTRHLSRQEEPGPEAARSLIHELKQAVLDTTDLLPDLQKAQVVDAGALAMFIFFEGFFKHLYSLSEDYVPITVFFDGRLAIAPSFNATPDDGYCVNTLMEVGDTMSPEKLQAIRSLGRSVVVVPQESRVRVHLHTDDVTAVRDQLTSLGQILAWTEEDMGQQQGHTRKHHTKERVHIMTDAAGSVTREDAERFGLTLLDSYLVFEDTSIPETLLPPADLYEAMRKGKRVSTAQASVFERHQAYSSIMAQHDRVVYLCVGSVYTGNYQTAVTWKEANDPHNRLRVVDTGAASGRLGVLALKVAEYAGKAGDIDDIVDFAEQLIDTCREFIFLERLKYLVAGGRLSPSSGFFGDLLKLKPVISPTVRGAEKAGVVRNSKGQIRFALEKLDHYLDQDQAAFILLEYSDNRAWVEGTVLPQIKQRFPLADVLLHPLSLTSGTHMGPGTWGVAFLPDPLA